jgi:hypothetical protein
MCDMLVLIDTLQNNFSMLQEQQSIGQPEFIGHVKE